MNNNIRPSRRTTMVATTIIGLLLAVLTIVSSVDFAAIHKDDVINNNNEAAAHSFSSLLLLRGSWSWNDDATNNKAEHDDDDDNDDSMAPLLRRLMIQSSPISSDDTDNSINNNNNRTASSSSSLWHYSQQWSSLSEVDLGAIAYDASAMSKDGHQMWGAAYISGRGRTLLLVEEDDDETSEAATDAASIRSPLESIPSFLRGATSINNEEKQDDDDSRNLQSWTSHAQNNNQNNNQINNNNNDPMGGLTFGTIQEYTASLNEENENEEATIDDGEELKERLEAANKVTQGLNTKHLKYDTNELYNYSNPNIVNNVDNTTTNATGNSSLNDMQQFSHTAQSSRQRLLTGSYAAWQWYDRSNLAAPSNLNLQKVSRINYAFFQSDAEGYVFGTDSWADPNVLFGSYEFATSSDRLEGGCRGGKGRDDGKYEGFDDVVLTTTDNTPSSKRRRALQTTLTTDDDATNTSPPNDTTNTKNEQICEYFEQCHRNFPNSKSCNIHKYKQGLIYRAHTSGAQIYPSIGGWTLSGSFPTVAADVVKRKRFAKECVGLIADYGFDGIDIDWEYPGYEPHGGSPQDRDNFNRLLLDVREALNEYQVQTGDAPLGGGAFGLTAALPCGPSNIEFLDVPFLAKVLDGMNLMTFDFHNEMEGVTGVNSPLFDQSWDEEPGLSVDGCVKNYYEGGAGDDAEKISIGIPFYGKTYSYATELNGYHSNTNGRGEGMADQANWPQDLGTPVYYNILDKLSKGGMTSVRHEPTMSQYAYFKDGSGLVTYDDPQAVCDKAGYVNQNLLGGVFVWEMSGDLMEDLETPLLDAINRKLEETNFDCRLIESPEDGSLMGLPERAAKGPQQVERREDESTVTSIIDHLQKAEGGDLVSGGGGKGAFTRAVFVYRTWNGRLFPSYVYRYVQMVDALRTMSTVGVGGDLFYLGYGQVVIETEKVDETAGEDDTQQRRQLQFGEDAEKELGATEVSQTSLVYGLVNLAAYLAQAMTDSIIHDACDELNIDHLTNDDTDGVGLNDGNDIHRFPISNACGQQGRSYADEICDGDGESKYDCTTQMNTDELRDMEARGISRGHWGGAPGPFYCGPKEVYGTTGFWDAMAGREMDDVMPTPNDSGRTDVEGCCWWGRGSLSIKGTCLYGKLNYHLGKNKADREGPENAMFPDVDFCKDPGQICTGLNSVPLRWISGMYHWMENVQKYDKGGFKYMDELTRYVNGDLVDTKFFEGVTNIHVLGCHDGASCSDRSVMDYDDRLRAFEKILALFGLQFGSHAEPEPPFRAFPGQQQPTPPPTTVGDVIDETESPTPAPVAAVEVTEVEIVPVNVFLTGVPDGVNMTNAEQQVFESLMYDLLVPRLGTVDVKVLEVVTDHQIPNPENYEAESAFETASDGEEKPVLQMVMNVTLSYNPPRPEVVRDWSLYIKSWINSFGNTMVEIFTTPKHPQHPQTNSKFWDDVSLISATNVNPPNTEPTMSPSPPPPPVIIYPDNSKITYLYAGIGAGLGLLVCCFCCCFCFKLRQYRQLQASAGQNKHKAMHWDSDDDEESSHQPQDRGFASNPALGKSLTKVAEESSYESESSDDDSSSSDDSSSESESSEEEDEEESYVEESVYTNQESHAKSQSTGFSEYDEESEAVESAAVSRLSRDIAGRENDELVSTGYEDESAATGYEDESVAVSFDDTMTRSKSASTGMSSGMMSRSMQSQSTHGDEDSEAASNALHASVSSAATQSRDGPATNLTEEKEFKQFDDIVECVLANDPTLKQVVLDDRKHVEGFHYGAEDLWNALVGNNYVERLSLRSCNITDEEAASLSLALVDNTSITHVWLGENDITSEGVEYLIATLESNQTIVHLELSGNVDVDPALEDEVQAILGPREEMYRSEPEIDEVVQLMERVRNNDPTLTKLDLCSMNIGLREDALSVFDALAGNTYIEKVDLSMNEIDDDCISSISLALLENMGVRVLNLANNSIYSEGAEYLIGTLESNKTLVEINLSGNHIDADIVEEINAILDERRGGSIGTQSVGSSNLGATVRRLASNDTNLVELKLDGIELTQSPETDSLFDALASNTYLTSMSFDNTDMDDTMVAALSLALVDNITITHISLRDNQITSEGCEYLLGTLDSNTAITHVDLSGNFIDESLMSELDAIVSQRQSQSKSSSRGSEVPLSSIIELVKSNDPTLTDLLLDNSDLAASHEIEVLFDALASNTNVRKISLCNNAIDDSLAAALSLALVDNTSIEEVLLSDNQITSEGCEYLLGTLDSNKTVSYVDLNGNLIDDRLMHEIDVINESRNSSANPAPLSVSTTESSRVEGNVDLSKPPMHEVPEESDTELAKRKAIMAIMRDTSIPWQEKNQRILEAQQQFFVPKDGNEEPPQAQAENAAAKDDSGRVQSLIDRVFDNDRNLKEIELDGQELGREDETALFEALAQNSCVTSLSLVNCKITNEGAAELTNALKQNSTLTNINLEDNQISSNAALDLMAVLKEHNETVEYLELKDNRVRSGLLSQIKKLLEKRREGDEKPEPVVAAAAVATTSYAQVAPTATMPADVGSASSNRKSGSTSSKSKSGRSKSSKSSKSRRRREREEVDI